MENKSGLHPTGTRVLVLLDPVPTKSGLVALHESTINKDEMAQVHATLVEKGPLAETTIPIGSAVVIKRYAGEYLTGMDLVKYRLINDADIYATRDFNLPS